ncbi:MAG: ribosome maturation factor RimP [Actinomycetota bacterium]|nr:ribosome maturation factor RimP [Actinomycetota bacterium]
MSATQTQVEAARAAVAPVVAALGCSLYDIELSGAGKARTLRVTIDRAGGADLETIAEATKAISPVLDDISTLGEPYLLEVSSPGIERTLRTVEHFGGAIGADVSIKFHTEAGPRRTHGSLVEADDTSIVVESEGERLTISYDDITQARTVFEWGPQPREKTRARAKEKQS